MVDPQEIKPDSSEPRIYAFGEYRIEQDERLLKRGEKIVPLPPKVIDLLLVLVESGGRVLAKDELMRRVWADSFVEETNLTHNISLLRRTFGEKQNGTKYIETIPRRGYRFIAAVRRVDDEAGGFELIALERTETKIVVEEECEAEPEAQTLSSSPTADKRRKSIFVAAALIAAFLAAAAGFWFIGRGGNRAAKTFRISEIRRVTTHGSAMMAAVSPDGKFVAYIVENNRRESLWVRNISTESNIPVFSDSAAAIKSVKFGPGDRVYFVVSDTLCYVPLLGGPVQKVLNVAGGSAKQIFSFSPDGKKIAFMRVSEDSSVSLIMIADADGENERLLATSRHPAAFLRSPAWSPDGTVIAMPMLTEDGTFTIGIIKVADGTVSPIPAPKWGFIEQAEWMPDSRSLLALVGDGEIWRVSYPDGASEKLTDELTRFSTISLSADGETLIATKQEQDGHIWVLPVGARDNARQVTRGVDKNDGGLGLDWLSNDSIRYEAGRSTQSWTIDIEGRNAIKTVTRPTGMSTVSADKKFIVFQDYDENGYVLSRINIANGELRRLAAMTPVWARVSPDGKWVVFTHYKEDISIWKVSIDGGEPEQVTRLSGYAHCPVVSPDGTRVAFVWWESPKSDAPAKIAIVSFKDGSLLTTLPAPISEQGKAGAFNKETVEWTADGKAIDYIQLRDGAANIWRQPVDGSPPVQITFFETGRIANFAYSPDFKNVALSRGNFASDVFLLKNSK